MNKIIAIITTLLLSTQASATMTSEAYMCEVGTTQQTYIFTLDGDTGSVHQWDGNSNWMPLDGDITVYRAEGMPTAPITVSLEHQQKSAFEINWSEVGDCWVFGTTDLGFTINGEYSKMNHYPVLITQPNVLCELPQFDQAPPVPMNCELLKVNQQ